MRSLILALIITLAASLGVQAQTWVIEPDSRSLTFSFDSPAGFVEAALPEFNAEITFDPNDLANAEVVANIDTGSFTSDQWEATRRVQKPDFFDAAAFDKAYFVGRDFRSLGGDRYAVEGFLQIRDVTSDFGFEFTLGISGDTAAFNATFPLNRLLAGLGNEKFPDNSELTVEIPINLSFFARRAP